MHFHISGPERIADANTSIGEIGAGMDVQLSGFADFDGFALGGPEIGEIKTLQPPEVVQKVLLHNDQDLLRG